MTKKETQRLNDILGCLKKCDKYLSRPEIFHGHIGTYSAMPENRYINSNGIQVSPITKFIGSDMNYLRNAIDKLERFLMPTPLATPDEF